MVKDKILRLSLWASVLYNFFGVYLLSFPSSQLGQLFGFPDYVPPLYMALSSFSVFLFGCVYAWIASQQLIDRSLVWLSSIAKFGVFILAIFLLIFNHIPWTIMSIGIIDLAFGLIWIWWIIKIKAQITL